MNIHDKYRAIVRCCNANECGSEGCPLYDTKYSEGGVCYEVFNPSKPDDAADIENMYHILFGWSKDDPVNHPNHYTSGGIECLDALEASMSPIEYAGFLKGQVFKYIWRYRLKGKPLEDLKKARFYLDRLIQITEREEAVV